MTEEAAPFVLGFRGAILSTFLAMGMDAMMRRLRGEAMGVDNRPVGLAIHHEQ